MKVREFADGSHQMVLEKGDEGFAKESRFVAHKDKSARELKPAEVRKRPWLKSRTAKEKK
jgi:hypothetical protein